MLIQELQVRQDTAKPSIGECLLTPNVDSFYLNVANYPGLVKIMYPATPSALAGDRKLVDVLNAPMTDGFILWSTPVDG